MSLDEIRGFVAWLNDPESDPMLVFGVEEFYGVTP